MTSDGREWFNCSRQSCADLMVSRKVSIILWQDLLQGITQAEFDL
jgi:hypothetical protein